MYTYACIYVFKYIHLYITYIYIPNNKVGLCKYQYMYTYVYIQYIHLYTYTYISYI